MKFTKMNVGKIKLPPGKAEAIIFDEDLAGFGVRIRLGGKKTWIAQYRIGKRQRRVTLGTLAQIDADEARKRARRALSLVHLGKDPAIEVNDGKAQASLTLGLVADDYLERAAKPFMRPRYYVEVERHLKKHWAPLRDRPIAGITRADIAKELAAIGIARGLFAANRARSSISTLFGWAIGEGLIGANPAVGTNKPTDETSRDRVLTNDELALVWRCAGDGSQYGAIIRLLILNGARRDEVGGADWNEFYKDIWTVPGGRTKNGLPLSLPQSSQSFAIFEAQTRRNDRSLIFGKGKGGFSGWSKAKKELDERMIKAASPAVGAGLIAKPWRVHDLRRTFSTGMNNIGVKPHVVEELLNHISSGAKAGVAGTYNHSKYDPEKREALQRWANHIDQLVAVTAPAVAA